MSSDMLKRGKNVFENKKSLGHMSPARLAGKLNSRILITSFTVNQSPEINN